MEEASGDRKILRVINIPTMLKEVGLVDSRSHAERLIKAGAVEIDGTRVDCMTMVISERT